MSLSTSQQIVFIDAAVSNADSLLANIDPSFQVIRLTADSSALSQMASALQGQTGIEAIHLISHGSAGELDLASGALDIASLSEAANVSALQTIQSSLSANADFLIYGCDVAAGTTGQAFINALATATGADVAASTDTTGALALGGNWVLESQTGAIEATSIAATDYAGVLAGSYAPYISGKDTASMSEDGTISLSGFTIGDLDGGSLTVRVSAASGTLNLGTTTGLTGTTSGASITFSGAISSLNTAINTLQYSPTANFNGNVPLTLDVSDDSGATWHPYTVDVQGKFFNPANGHYYEFVNNPGISWNNALTAAASRTLYGMNGYLATVTSAEENAFIAPKLGGTGWMGASDAAVEGQWRWVSGPEAGQQISTPWTPWNLYSSGGYSNWSSGEPNNWGGNENAGQFYVGGTWNDLNANNTVQGYVVEYGGAGFGGTTPTAASLTITVNPVNDPPQFTSSPVVVAYTDTLSTDTFTASTGFISAIAGPANSVPLESGTVSYSLVGGTTSGGLSSQTSAYGTLVLNTSTGAYTFNPLANAINALPAGSNPSAGFTVRISDGSLTTDQSFTVNITGANDRPSLTTDAVATTIAEDFTNSLGQTVTDLFAPRFTDIDSGASLGGVVIVGNAATAGEGVWQYKVSGGSWQAIGTSMDSTSGLALAATTSIRFVPAQDYNGAPGALTVHAADNAYVGGFSTDTTPNLIDVSAAGISAASKTLAITVTAVNDAPTFTSAAGAASITETAAYDSALTAGPGSLSGTLTAHDVDSTLTGTAAFGVRGGSVSDTTVTKVGIYGTLTVDSITGAWSYAPNNDVAINALPAGATAYDVFDFKVVDPQGAYSLQALTITLHGTNDTPVLAAAIVDQSFSGSGTWSYQIPAASFTDAEGTGLTYTVQVVANADGTGSVTDTIAATTGGNVSLASSWLTFDEATRTFSGNPPAGWNDAGLHLKVTATDGASASASNTFSLTLTGTANQPPVVDHPLTWQAVNAPHEDTSVAFTGTLGGTTIAFDGHDPITLGSVATGSDVATAVQAAVHADALLAGSAAGHYDAVIGGSANIVTLTATAGGARTEFTDGATVNVAGGSYTVAVTQQGTNATPERVDVQFHYDAGNTTSVSFEGRLIDVSTAGDQVQVAAFVAQNINTNSLAWTALVDPVYTDTIHLTAKTAGSVAHLSTSTFDKPSVAAGVVITQQGDGAANSETVQITFNAITSAQDLVFDGMHIYLPWAMTADIVAANFYDAFSPGSGFSTNWGVNSLNGSTVEIIANSTANVTDLTMADFVPLSHVAAVNVISNGASAQTEIVNLTFDGSYGGATITGLDGVTATAGLAVLDTAVATAVHNATFADYTSTVSGNTVTFTNNVPGAQADIGTTGLTFTGTYIDTGSTATPATPSTQGAGWSYVIPDNTFSDPEGDTLTYTAYTVIVDGSGVQTATALTNTAALSFDASTLTLSGTGTAFSNTFIEIRATDGNHGANYASSQFQLVVYNDTVTPTLVAHNLPAVDFVNGAGSGSYTVPAAAFDYVATSAGTLTYKAGVYGGGLLPDWLVFDAATHTFTGNPPDGATSPNVVVYASNDAGANWVYINSFVLNIANVNDPIVLSHPIADQSFPGAAVSLSVSLPFTNPDGNADGSLSTSGITYTALANGNPLSDYGLTLSTDGSGHLLLNGNPPGGTPYLNIVVTGTEVDGGSTASTSFTLNLSDPTANTAATLATLGSNNIGTVAFTGTPTQGQLLTASVPVDTDGYSGPVVYQWQVSSNDTTWTDVAGTRGQASTLTLAQSEVNQYVRVQAFYTDNGGVAEAPVSGSLSVADVPDPGTVVITGAVVPGSSLSATISDADGLLTAVPTYQWQVGSGSTWTNISGATYSNYTLTNAEGGQSVRVQTSYVDDMGYTQTLVTSDPTALVQLGAVAPVAVNDVAAAVTENSGANNTTVVSVSPTGNLLANDTDANSGDTKTVTSLRTGSAEGLGVAASDAAVLTLNGDYGVLQVTKATGAYIYTVTQNNAAVQALNVGDHLTETFNYTVTDSTALSDVGVLTLTIDGANDLPTVSGIAATATVVEDAATALPLNLSFIDPDSFSTFQFQLHVTAGTLRASSSDVTITGSDTATLTITASSIDVLNTWIASNSVSYVTDPNANGAVATLSYALDDGSGFVTAGSTTAITATAANDAPIVDVGGALTAGNDFVTLFRPRGTEVQVVASGITITDIDSADTLQSAIVTLATGAKDNQFGTIFETLHSTSGSSYVGATTLTITGNGDTSIDPTGLTGATQLTFTGTGSAADYQNALKTVIYNDTNPNAFAGDRTITVSLTDSHSQVSNAASFATASSNTAIAVGQRIFIDNGYGTLVDSGQTVAVVNDSQHFVASGPLSFVSSSLMSFYDGTGLVTSSTQAGPLVATITMQVPWTPAVDMNGVSGAVADHAAGYGVDNFVTYTEGPLSATGTPVAVATSDASITAQGGLINTITVTLMNPLDGVDGVSEHLTVENVAVTSWLSLHHISFTGSGSHQIVFTAEAPGSDATNFQVALRSVLYSNDSQNPNTSLRTVTVATLGEVDYTGVAHTGVSANTYINVVAVNDAPTVSGPLTYSANEGATSHGLNLLLNASDVDSTPLYVSSVSYQVDGGSSSDTAPAGVSLSGTTLTVDPTNAAYDHLAVGESTTIVVSYNVDDHSALLNTVAQTQTITINGTNDAPTVSATETAGFTEAGNAVAQNLNDSGTVTFGDIDTTDTVSISAALDVNGVVWSGGTIGAGLASQLAAGFHTTATDAAAPGTTGWTYDVTGANLDFLAAGETITFSYTVTATDNNGGTATTPVSFTITGSNDAPTVSATATAGFTEATNAAAQNLSDSGTVTFGDIDTTDTVSISAALDVNGVVWSGGTIGAGLASQLAAGFHTTATDAAAPGTTGWTYDVTGANLDFLAAGETITFSYTVTATDNNGGTATTPVSFTITGTNDATTVTSVSTTATGSITEATLTSGSTSPDTASGSIAFADADLTDTHAISVTGHSYVWTGGTLSSDQQVALTSAFLLDTKVDSTGTGSGTQAWSFSAADSTFDFLASGETITATYTVTVDDGHDSTAAQDVVVTITGTNDKPVIDLNGAGDGTDNLAVFNPRGAAVQLFNDYLTVSDPDHGDHLTSATLVMDSAATVDNAFGTTYETLSTTLAGGVYSVGGVTITFSGNGTGTRGLTDATELTLSGDGSAADYKAALLTVIYNNTNPNAYAGIRPIAVTLHDAATDSVAATLNVNVNWGPVVDLNGQDALTGVGRNYGPLTYTENNPGLAIAASDASLVDQDGNIDFVVINLTNHPDGSAETLHVSAAQVSTLLSLGITISGNNSTAITVGHDGGMAPLGLDGTYFQLALRAIEYTNTSNNPDETQRVVTVQATDMQGHPGVGATTTINPHRVNDVPTGAVTIANDTIGGRGVTAAQQGDVLSVTDNIADLDGISGTIHYQWKRAGADISGETGSTHTLTQADVGHVMTVVATYVDFGGTHELVTSNATNSIINVNDAPVLSGTTPPSAVAELTNAAAQDLSAITGSFGVNDIDNADTLTPSVVSTTVLLDGSAFTLPAGATALTAEGAFALTGTTSNGGDTSIGYTYNPAAANLDFLAEGQSLTINYVVKVNDGTVDSGTQAVTFTITGTNDAPVAVADTGATTENATLTVGASGVLFNDTDVDTPDTHSVSAVNGVGADVATGVAGTYGGTFTIAANGSYTFNPGTAFDYLAQGETATTSVDYTNTDNNGLSSSSTLTVTVTGTNDAPVAVADIGATTENLTMTVDAANGVLSNDTDLDTSDTHTVSAVNSVYGNVGVGVTGSHGGTFTINTDGSYSFVPGTAFDYLALGDTQTTSVTYTNLDSHGGTASNTLTVTVTGTNDQPSIAVVDVTGGVTENPVNLAAVLSDSGSVNFSDLDTSNNLTSSVVLSDAVASGNSIVVVNSALHAALSNALVITQTGTNHGSIDWNFAIANSFTEYLAQGTSVTATYTITVNDHSGASNATQTQDVVVTLTGTNDAPYLNNALVDQSSKEGQLFSYDIQARVANNGDPLPTFWDNDLPSGDVLTFTAFTYNTATQVTTLLPTWLTINSTTGVLSGTPGLNDYVANGLDVKIVATDLQNTSIYDYVKITTLMKPTLAAVTAGSIAEVTLSANTTDATLIGTLSGHDVNNAAVLTYGATGATVTAGVATLVGAYGTLTVNTSTGDYSYAKNAGTVETLHAGQTTNDTFSMTVTDNYGLQTTQNYVVNLTGANDAPTLAAVTAGSIAEVTLSANTTDVALTGTLVGHDVDNNAVLTYGATGATVAAGVATLVGAYGTLTVNTSTGDYSYAKNAGAVDALHVGQTANDTFTLTVTDDQSVQTTQNYVVNLTGANDAPTLAAVTAGSIAEVTLSANTTDVALTGTLVGHDVDNNAVLTYGATGATVAAGVATLVGAYGTLTVNTSTGDYSYAKNAGAVDALHVGQTANDTFTLTVTDDQSVQTTQNYVVNLTGANDAPTLAASAASATLVEAGGLFNGVAGVNASSITLTKGDVDGTTVYDTGAMTTDGWTTSDAGITYTKVGVYGSATLISSTGVVNYALNDANAATQALNAADHVTDSFTAHVIDNNSATSSIAVVFNISGTNDAPYVAIPLFDLLIQENQPFTYAFQNHQTPAFPVSGATFQDVDAGDVLTFTATLLDGAALSSNARSSWLSIDAANGVLSGTPFDGTVGSIDIKVTATDSHGAQVSDFVTITVNPVNDAPALTGTGAVLPLGSDDTPYTFSAANLLVGYTDEEGNTPITVSNVTVDHGTLTNNGDGTYTVTSVQNYYGPVTINYMVSDSLGASAAASQSFRLNHAPTGTATATLAAAIEDTPYTVVASSLLAGFSDVDGDALSVSGLTANHGAVVDNGNGSFTVTPSLNYNGSVSLSYNVVDTHGRSVAATQSFSVTGVNDAPYTAAPMTGQIAHGNMPFSYAIQSLGTPIFNDVDIPYGDVLTFSATRADGSALNSNALTSWIQIDPVTGHISGTPGHGLAGLASIKVIAIDHSGASASDFVTITVIGNGAPTGSLTVNGIAAQGQTLTVVSTIADVDGVGTLNYQWSADGVAINGATTDAFTLTQAQVGQTISVVASYTDGAGAAEHVTSTATSSVANVNDLPTGVVTIAGIGAQNQVLTASNTLADVDGLGAISYQWMANGQAIAGATGDSLLLGQAQMGKGVTVVASYTDGFGAHESVSSGITIVAPDGLAYIASYSDLLLGYGANAEAGVLHYIEHGYAEGRTVSFDGLAYIASNVDLLQGYGANAEAGVLHYIEHGYAEGRTVSFDGLAYIASNVDLLQGYGANAEAGVLHYIEHGYAEGRTVSFDGLAYIASNVDLLQGYGANAEAGVLHYIEHGYAEGRTVSFDGLAYIASNVDLLQGYGANAEAGVLHYIEHGFAEGRSTSFNAQDYLAKYEDLRASCGTDAHAAEVHYIEHGFYEGRSADLSGNDTLTGSSQADVLNGHEGNDVLYGAGGADTLIGGLGADQFLFKTSAESTATQMVTIADFNSTEGDVINLMAVDADANTAGAQHFNFIGTAAFTGHAGELRFDAASHQLMGDTTGDAQAHMQILLVGVTELNAASLLLA